VSATTTNTDSNALTYSVVSGPCALVSGATFSSSGAGICVVKASGAATANFLTASQTQNVTISAAQPTITFGAPPTPTYLGPNFTVSATTTNTDSNALTYSVVSGPCSLVSGATFSSSGAGTCVVKAYGAATANFLAASQTQNVTISPATPTITFGPAPSPTYPGSNFTVSATTNSNGTLSYSYVSGPCSLVSASAGTFSPTGTGMCVVQANTTATSNFIAGLQQQSVTISSGAWTITTTAPCPFFGTLSLGQSSTCVFTVYNPTATATAITVSVPRSGNEGPSTPNEVDPDDYVITGNTCRTVSGGGHCTVTVTWTPDLDDLPLYPTGSLAYLQVANSNKTVLTYATMTGKALDPTVTLTDDDNNFTSTTPVTQTVATLTNPSNQITDLILGKLSVSSGWSYFKLASGPNSCTSGSTMTPGATCYIYVTFTPPPSGTATETGTVCIGSNAANGPLNVALWGKR